MDQNLDITINRLSAKTWYWLKMNEARVPVRDVFRSAESVISLPKGMGERHIKDSAIWKKIETGMGRDMEQIASEFGANLIFSWHYEEDGSEITRATDAPAVIRLSRKGNADFAKYYIYADANTALDVVIVAGRAPEKADHETGDRDTVLRGEEKISRILAHQVKIYAEEGSKVRLYEIQLPGSGDTFLCDIGGICEENAAIELTRVELGEGSIYTGVNIDLAGTESRFTSKVGYLAAADDKLDMNYAVRHHGKRTRSNMAVSGILRDNASKIFRGTIDFIAGCEGAKGDESEEVLLLGDSVVNRTIPLILCEEEDVEGNHGASIGELDEKTLFYLAARGISAEDAKRLVARARIESVAAGIPDETVREEIERCLA
ncbi:MAG: SufD family Fe-S cluster assembly protein [Lachnospiraceae bacterium]|nr:SufD family Fe-S cluster assembly protein [Lachnospiraceae bacterium]